MDGDFEEADEVCGDDWCSPAEDPAYEFQKRTKILNEKIKANQAANQKKFELTNKVLMAGVVTSVVVGGWYYTSSKKRKRFRRTK